MQSLTSKIKAGRDLDGGDISYGVSLLFSEQVPDALKAEFLIALHGKGETAEELVNFARRLMERAIDPMIDPANLAGPLLDVCGTGGDGFDSFNVSTTIMFILAAGNVVVVKHGAEALLAVAAAPMCSRNLGWRFI